MSSTEVVTNKTVHTVYDELNRPKEQRENTPTGPLMATWSYDAAGELGLPNSSTRVTSAGNWITDIAGYDAKNRPLATTSTVPAVAAGMAGDYTVTYGYDKADRVTSVSYPAIGGLPAETVTTRYNAYGLPDDMTGIDHYVWDADFDSRGRPVSLGYGPTKPDGSAWLGRHWTYDADQRLSKVESVAGVATNEHGFAYNQVGTLTERTTKIDAQDWRECFSYDDRYRLTGARTVDFGAACAAATPDGGDQPYKQAFEYTVDGNIKKRIESGTTSTYNYPSAPGARQPHAPTSVVTGTSTDSYNWDTNTGRLSSRTVAGRTETFSWDPLGRLSSITAPDGIDSFTYGAGGERLMRSTPLGRTIYVAGHEVSAKLDGTNVKAVRSYRFGSQLVATRSPSGLDYVISDQQGSVEATYASNGGLETSRSYMPYGKRRSGGEFDTDQGWLGEIEDDHSGLQYLNARYYDAKLGVFISPDPIVNTSQPKSLNAYAYALNNPITYSDPTGLCVAIDGLCPQRWKDPYAIAIASTHAGTAKSAAMAYVRPNNYHYNPSKPQPGPDPVALAIAELYFTNPDPGFWAAVAASGGGEAFVTKVAVNQLMNVNPDPGFWTAVAAAGVNVQVLT